MISMLTIKVLSKSAAQQPSGWHLYENVFKVKQQTSRVRKKKWEIVTWMIRKEWGQGSTSGTGVVCGEDHCRADIDTATHGRHHSTWIISLRNCSSWRTHTGSGSPERSCSLWRDHVGEGKKCEEEGAAEELLRTLYNPTPHVLLGGWGRWVRNEINPGKRRGEGNVGMCFLLLLLFTSHYPNLL